MFLAHAGMNLTKIVSIRRVPRACGDEPGNEMYDYRVFPACAGMNQPSDVMPRPVVFPAHAGMNRPGMDIDTVFPVHAGMFLAIRSSLCARVPRVRGDDPESLEIKSYFAGVFPAYAGMIRLADPDTSGMFPAHAGMNRAR